MFGLVAVITRIIANVYSSRQFRGPLVEGWSFALEVFISYMRMDDSKFVKLLSTMHDIKEINPEQGRKDIDNLVGEPKLPSNIVRNKIYIKGTECNWIYSKSEINVITPTLPNENDMKTIVYLHGGGYVMMSVNTHINMILRLMKASGKNNTRVLAVEYKLAPEHPFPYAINEVVNVYKWMLNDMHISPSSICFAGDSAGGGLCLASTLKIKELGLPQHAGLCLMSPWVDLRCIDQSYVRNKYTDYISQNSCKVIAEAYAGEEKVTHPLISPILADLTGLPPMIIQVGEKEVFLDSILKFADKAKADGVQVILEIYTGMPHVFQSFPQFIPTLADQAISNLGHFVKDMIKKDQTPPREHFFVNSKL